MSTLSSRSQSTSWPTWSVPQPDYGMVGESPSPQVAPSPAASGSNQAALAAAGLAIDRAIDHVDPDALAGALSSVPPLGPPAAPVDPDARARFAAATALDSVLSNPVKVRIPNPPDLAAWWPGRSAWLADAVGTAAVHVRAMSKDHDETSAAFAAQELGAALSRSDDESRPYTLAALPRPRSAALSRAVAQAVPALAGRWRLDPAAQPKPDAKKPLLGDETAMSDEDPVTLRPRVDRGWVSENTSSHAHAEASATSRSVSGNAGFQTARADGADLRQSDASASGTLDVDGRFYGKAGAGHSTWVTDEAGHAKKTGEATGAVQLNDGALSASGRLAHFDGNESYASDFDVSADGFGTTLGYAQLDDKGEATLKANGKFEARTDGFAAGGDVGWRSGEVDLGVSGTFDSDGKLGGRLSASSGDYGGALGGGVAWTDEVRGGFIEAGGNIGAAQASASAGRQVTFTDVKPGPDGRYRTTGADTTNVGYGLGASNPMGVSGTSRRSADQQHRETRSFATQKEAEAWRATGLVRNVLRMTLDDVRAMRPGDSVEHQGTEQGGHAASGDAFGSSLGIAMDDSTRVKTRIERLDGDRARITRETVSSASAGFDTRFAAIASASNRDLSGSTRRNSIDLNLTDPRAAAVLVSFRDRGWAPESSAVLAKHVETEDRQGDSGQAGIGGLSATRTSTVVSRTEIDDERARRESEGTWGLSWNSDWFGWWLGDGSESHAAEAGFFLDNGDRALTTRSHIDHGDVAMNREALHRSTGVAPDRAQPRPNATPSGPWLVETSFHDEGADRVRAGLDHYAGAGNVTPGVARAGALLRASSGMEGQDAAVATMSAEEGADALGFMRDWAHGEYEQHVSPAQDDGGLMGMRAVADARERLTELEHAEDAHLGSPAVYEAIRSDRAALLARIRKITDYSAYAELPDALRRDGLSVVQGLKRRYDKLLQRAEAARGEAPPSPETAQAKARMTEAFEAMEQAYRAAREEMNVHLTPKAADPAWRASQAGRSAGPADLSPQAATRTRRDELCSAVWWWDTDESSRYAAADKLMAEGEQARKEGADEEAKAETSLQGAKYAAATKAYVAATTSFEACHGTLRAIARQNDDLFQRGA